MTKITLNGIEIDADPSHPLVNACHAAGVHVPTYCYHPGLSPVGSCRMCQVEVQQGEMPARVVAACKTPVAEGMVVETDSVKARQVRKECLEYLLKDHPLDCPICDKAGECDLQDFAFLEGQDEGRTREPRAQRAKRKSLGDVIVLDEERCILCSRCVRFFEEVTGKPQLTVAGLGWRSHIDTFAGRPLEGNYQGNIADICPVGALTLKDFRFQARVWNLRRTPSTCAECSRGCATAVEVLRRDQIKRFRPRYDAAVNRWWMCDTGRFATARYQAPQRLVGGAVRGSQGLEGVPVSVALDRAADSLAVSGKTPIVASPFLTVEEGRSLLEFAAVLGSEVVMVSPAPNALADDLLHTGDPCPNRRGLTELGIEAVAPEALHGRLSEFEAALLVGERVCELLEPPAPPVEAAEEPAAAEAPAESPEEAPKETDAAPAPKKAEPPAEEPAGPPLLADLPAGLRLVVLDTHAPVAPAVHVCLAVPFCVERGGTWVNVDGLPRKLAPSRPRPTGVSDVPELLRQLAARLSPTEVQAR